ncbi:hypothetical protein GCM10022403_022680 [Streptomyces coacervatus]|uniref:Uncharacterized protein n=1 Tax=Streptomyces coacervatus TaxID=647381 RepID=A0ABP7HAS0_9ACTN|nr:hypothetical protein [Streptomyces coacervatus]MDF2267735.1 hypothetical protein [Streptomyces coacervatus]
MDESRQFSPDPGAVPRKPAPPPALCGFLLLLLLIFAVSYVVGAHAGPVAPGMHGTGTSKGGGGGSTGDDMGNMHGGGN